MKLQMILPRERTSKIAAFRAAVWAHYRAAGRHDLPWRKTRNAYHILVSEVMLQQTQVSRVQEKYRAFIVAFPTVQALATAELSDVLKHWQGLGYNRRAKYLRDSARLIVDRCEGDIRRALAEKLPGVGPYTRAAVRIFAYNEPHTTLETNIRAAYIHRFFPDTPIVDDRHILVYAAQAARGQDPREWHWALMDYGAHVKKLHENPTRNSATYVMQSRFEGSLRQIRGKILRLLDDGEFGDLAIARRLAHDERRVREALSALARDGLVIAEKGSWRIA